MTLLSSHFRILSMSARSGDSALRSFRRWLSTQTIAEDSLPDEVNQDGGLAFDAASSRTPSTEA